MDFEVEGFENRPHHIDKLSQWCTHDIVYGRYYLCGCVVLCYCAITGRIDNPLKR